MDLVHDGVVHGPGPVGWSMDPSPCFVYIPGICLNKFVDWPMQLVCTDTEKPIKKMFYVFYHKLSPLSLPPLTSSTLPAPLTSLPPKIPSPKLLMKQEDLIWYFEWLVHVTVSFNYKYVRSKILSPNRIQKCWKLNWDDGEKVSGRRRKLTFGQCSHFPSSLRWP